MRNAKIIFGVVVAGALIAQSVVLARLSGRIDRIRGDRTSESAPEAESGDIQRRSIPAHDDSSALAQLLRAAAKAPAVAENGADSPSPPAVDQLAQALATPQGRTFLRGAMDILREEDRQARLSDKIPKKEADSQRWKEEVLTKMALSPAEQGQASVLFAQLTENRQRVLAEMRAGSLKADDADNELDALKDSHEDAVKKLVGDERLKQFRETRKKEREAKKQAKRGAAPPTAVPVPPPPPTGVAVQ